MSYFKVNSKCNGCLACIQNCPAGALKYNDTKNERKILHNITRCARCAQCWRVCPQQAIEFEYLLKNEWDDVVSLELIYCSICQEPIYTIRFEETIQTKVTEKPEILCAAHKRSNALSMWKHKIV